MALIFTLSKPALLGPGPRERRVTIPTPKMAENLSKANTLQGRIQGGPGVPVTPLLQAFFNQTT